MDIIQNWLHPQQPAIITIESFLTNETENSGYLKTLIDPLIEVANHQNEGPITGNRSSHIFLPQILADAYYASSIGQEPDDTWHEQWRNVGGYTWALKVLADNDPISLELAGVVMYSASIDNSIHHKSLSELSQELPEKYYQELLKNAKSPTETQFVNTMTAKLKTIKYRFVHNDGRDSFTQLDLRSRDHAEQMVAMTSEIKTINNKN